MSTHVMTPPRAVSSGSSSSARDTVVPFAIVAAITITFLGASSAPTPLYASYQESFSLAPVTVTAVFAAYAVALLISLLITGRLSDFLGRKPVILAAIVVEIIAMVVFAVAGSALVLVIARVLQGLATGTATAVSGAALTDLLPRWSAVTASVSPVVGMAAGALGSGLLVVHAPEPDVLVYLVFLGLFVALGVAAAMMRETAPRRPGAVSSLRPRVSVPPAARRPLAVAAPILVAVWSLGGFYLSLGPKLASEITGNGSPLIGAYLVSALTFSGAAAILLLRSWAPVRVFTIGAAALVAGLSLTLAGVMLQSAVPLFAGSVVAGVGFGAGFQGAMRTVMPTAGPDERAGLLSTFYIISYLSMGIPAVVAGLLTNVWGIETTAMVVGGVLIVLAAAALVSVSGTRRAPDERPAHLVSGDDVRRHSERTVFALPADRHEQVAGTVNHIDSVTRSLRAVDLGDTPPAPSFSVKGPNA